MSQPVGTALIYVPEGVDPRRKFAGRSLIERSLAIAGALGLSPVLVGSRGATASAAGIREATGSGSGEGHAGVRWVEPGARFAAEMAVPSPPRPVLLWRCDCAFVAGVARAMLVRAGTGSAAALDDEGAPALVVLPASRIAGIAPAELALAASGCAVVDPPGRVGSHRLIALSASNAKGESGPGRSESADRGEVAGRQVLRGTDPSRAERILVATLENPRDGFFDAAFNRHLSRRLTPLLLDLPVTPNQVTFFSLAVGLLAAGALAMPGILWPIVGALLLQATAVLDCIDGEIARAKILESEWGELLDITTDSVIHVVVFLGMAVHAWPALGSETAWALGAMFATGGFASFAVVTRAERSEDVWKPLEARSWKARLLGRMLATLTTRDLSVLVLAAAATGMLTELLVGAAFGAHAFWAAALFLHRNVMREAAAQPAIAAEPGRAATGADAMREPDREQRVG